MPPCYNSPTVLLPSPSDTSLRLPRTMKTTAASMCSRQPSYTSTTQHQLHSNVIPSTTQGHQIKCDVLSYPPWQRGNHHDFLPSIRLISPSLIQDLPTITKNLNQLASHQQLQYSHPHPLRLSPCVSLKSQHRISTVKQAMMVQSKRACMVTLTS